MRKSCGILLAIACLSALASFPTLAAPRADDVAWEAVWISSIKRTFGTRRGTYFLKNALISEQVLLGFGHPDSEVRLSDGAYLVTGCRHRSCPQKAALIATENGDIRAAGLLHNPSAFAPPKSPFEYRVTLSIFVTPAGDRPMYVRRIQEWARTKTAEMRRANAPYQLAKVQKTVL